MANNKKKVQHPYGKRRDKSGVLVGSDGRQYHQKIEAVLSSIRDPGARIQAKTIIKNAHEDKERLTMRSLQSKMAFAKEEKFLINAGYTRESFEAEFGITFEDFEDESNWITDPEGKKRFSMNGMVYELVFDYSGQILRRLQ